jgi:enolase-phosphatase E1
MPESITHLLLDIEGTTCPVDFVANTLFPYSTKQLHPFLVNHQKEVSVQELLQQVEDHWKDNPDETAQNLWQSLKVAASGATTEQLTSYLDWLILTDQKVTCLKELQGLIWEEGYVRGELSAPLFPEVAEVLRDWHHQGLTLAVYSSGSVAAQQLLYRHSIDGNLEPLFSAWFDTRIGPKQASESYHRIAEAMSTPPSKILFISDSLAELTAADQAGLPVRFSARKSNPERDPGPFRAIKDLKEVRLP